VTGFTKTGAGVQFIVPISSEVHLREYKTVAYNNFSDITLSGATAFMEQETDGGTPTKIYSDNTISNVTGGTSQITG